MRTALGEDEIQKRVANTITRLGLSECQNQSIGNWMGERISGGERKRTSIGYELVTNPSCLLLDEPTSGLDSASAMRVIEQLKLEANRGMAILASIHQPSAEILYMFDRVIVMSEGYMIYSGPPDTAR